MLHHPGLWAGFGSLLSVNVDVFFDHTSTDLASKDLCRACARRDLGAKESHSRRHIPVRIQPPRLADMPKGPKGEVAAEVA